MVTRWWLIQWRTVVKRCPWWLIGDQLVTRCNLIWKHHSLQKIILQAGTARWKNIKHSQSKYILLAMRTTYSHLYILISMLYILNILHIILYSNRFQVSLILQLIPLTVYYHLHSLIHGFYCVINYRQWQRLYCSSNFRFKLILGFYANVLRNRIFVQFSFHNAKKFSIGFMSGLLGGIENSCALQIPSLPWLLCCFAKGHRLAPITGNLSPLTVPW